MHCVIKMFRPVAVVVLMALPGCAALPTGKLVTFERVVAQFEATVTATTVEDDRSVRVLARSPCFTNPQITNSGVI